MDADRQCCVHCVAQKPSGCSAPPPRAACAAQAEHHRLSDDEEVFVLKRVDKKKKGDPDKDALYFFRKGNESYAQGRFQEAVDFYGVSLSKRRGFGDCLFNRANAYRALGKFKEAIRDYSEAIHAKPDDAGSWIQKGAVFFQVGGPKNLAKAVQCYTRALQLVPASTEALLKRGNAELALGDMDRAMEDYDACIKSPSCDAKAGHEDRYQVEAFVQRGMLWARKRHLRCAIRDLERARMLDAQLDQ